MLELQKIKFKRSRRNIIKTRIKINEIENRKKNKENQGTLKLLLKNTKNKTKQKKQTNKRQ